MGVLMHACNDIMIYLNMFPPPPPPQEQANLRWCGHAGGGGIMLELHVHVY
jgi:hypothetical protein